MVTILRISFTDKFVEVNLIEGIKFIRVILSKDERYNFHLQQVDRKFL